MPQQVIKLGFYGWLLNLNDGRMEAIACGDEQQLVTLKAWLRCGSPMSIVTNIQIENCISLIEYADLTIKHQLDT